MPVDFVSEPSITLSGVNSAVGYTGKLSNYSISNYPTTSIQPSHTLLDENKELKEKILDQEAQIRQLKATADELLEVIKNLIHK